MKNILRSILTLSAAGFCLGVHAQPRLPGDFPFFRSFLDDNLTYISFPGPAPGGDAAKRVNQAKLKEGYGLQLTEGLENVGAFYLPEHKFSTTDGLIIEFEYMMYGGTERTDGICMFLVNANDKYIGTNMKFGAAGAGFGYTYNWANSTANRIHGIKGAYLGVALDQGNFKAIRMESAEERNGIIYADASSGAANPIPPAYNTDSNVTIRGGAGPNSRGISSNSQLYFRDEACWGYPMLVTRYTGGASDPTNMRDLAAHRLNTTTGRFEQYSGPEITTPFHIASGGTFIDPDDPNYRKAIIALEPNTEGGGGFKITVTIQHGRERSVVIDKFTYPIEGNYPANDLPQTYVNGTPQWWPNPGLASYSISVPPQLVIGFSASTGTQTAYTNIIRNLRITPLYGASTANDDIDDHRRGPATIKPLDNDIGYMGEGLAVDASKDYLDPASFRFWRNEYNIVQDGSGNPVFEYDNPLNGKWVYDPATAEVMFFPRKGFTGRATILYDIKGLHAPYTDEKYRSSLAYISITVNDNQPVP